MSSEDCRVGSLRVSGVVRAELSRDPLGGKVQLAFIRAEGSGAPPEVLVPFEAEVVAFGASLGIRRICCTGRDGRDGGYLSVKWED